MNLQLFITKKEFTHYNTKTKTQHLFAVIDLDKSKYYPQNFVSVLPKNIKSIVKPANIFEGLFGNQSLEMAKELLEKALETRPSSETALAIIERLKLLSSPLNNKSKCQNCGNPIKQSKQRFRPYKFCLDCYRKCIKK